MKTGAICCLLLKSGWIDLWILKGIIAQHHISDLNMGHQNQTKKQSIKT